LKKKVQEIINTVFLGDCRDVLKDYPDKCVDTCITSPPYWGLRDYKVDNQIGLEGEVDEYISQLVDVFAEVNRILKDDGTLWLNLGDSYSGSTGQSGGVSEIQNIKRQLDTGSIGALRPANVAGLKNKDLIGIPWRVALALQADGWYLRQDIIWHKPNPMPESVTDRCTKAHEYIFLLSKLDKYHFDAESIKEPAVNPNVGESWAQRKLGGEPPRHGLQGAAAVGAGNFKTGDKRNKRSVWTVTTKPYAGAHFATFPSELITPCIKAGSRERGIVLDPFMGSGTIAEISKKLGRFYTGVELNEEYHDLIKKRTSQMEMFI